MSTDPKIGRAKLIWGALPKGDAPLNFGPKGDSPSNFDGAPDPAANTPPDATTDTAQNNPQAHHPNNNSEAPKSTQFDDIYFCGDGAAETSHVFIAGNDLPQRFGTAQHLQIGELGFGTGLNFLVLLDHWRRAQKPSNAHLSFFSLERYPLSDDELVRAHHAWPQYAKDSARLRAMMPPRDPGFHQRNISPNVTLTLFYGDAKDALTALNAQIDAWFLDGFSPANNPDMWSADLFALLRARSKPRASFATFSVAGHVRRALTSAGFELERRKGFGKKREMLTGKLSIEGPSTPKTFSIDQAPWFTQAAPRDATSPPPKIAILGGGIAGASLAHAISRIGHTPTIFEANHLASGASGNAAGLIMPRLDAEDTPPGRFHTERLFSHAWIAPRSWYGVF